jgi:hypothetical protein
VFAVVDVDDSHSNLHLKKPLVLGRFPSGDLVELAGRSLVGVAVWDSYDFCRFLR